MSIDDARKAMDGAEATSAELNAELIAELRAKLRKCEELRGTPATFTELREVQIQAGYDSGTAGQLAASGLGKPEVTRKREAASAAAAAELRAARGVTEPTPQEAAEYRDADNARWDRQVYLARTGQQEKAREEHAQWMRFIPSHGGAAALHLQRQPGGPACPDIALRIRIRAVRPTSRRRGAGSPSRRKTATASSGGSSDDSGPSDDGDPAPRNPADLETDIDVVALVGERSDQLAVRLAVVLAMERGQVEVVLSADPEVRDLVEQALPIVLSLLNRRGQTAAAAPTIFSDAWSIFVGEVTA